MEREYLEKNVLEDILLAGIKEQRATRRWKIFFRIIWVLIIGFAFYSFSGSSYKFNKKSPEVAVVDLNGVISDENHTYDTIDQGLIDALKSKDTVAVIIKANSPGGSPVYSDMLYNEIIRLRKEYPDKPIDVVIEEVCASGCYYIASAANKIYASRASIIGSIGVIYTGFGLTGMMAKIGVDSRLLISGKNKSMGYPFIPDNKDQTAMQQTMLDEVHDQFISAVKAGRGDKLNLSDPDLFSGRYWLGQDSLKLGLIDGYSTVDNLARDEYNTDNIVDFTPDQTPLEKLTKTFGTEIVGLAKQALSIAQFGYFK